jgi:hypothetical protein
MEENRHKHFKSSWKVLKENVSEKTEAQPGTNYASLFFDIVRELNPILLKLKKLDAKFPPRPDETTILETAELQSIIGGFESLSKHCHEKGCDRLMIAKYFGQLMKRLGDYWVVISEFSANIAGIEQPIVELGNLVQKVRKAYRKV